MSSQPYPEFTEEWFTLDQKTRGVFQESLYLVQEARSDYSVNYPMVACGCDHHDLADVKLTVAHDGAIFNGAYG